MSAAAALAARSTSSGIVVGPGMAKEFTSCTHNHNNSVLYGSGPSSHTGTVRQSRIVGKPTRRFRAAAPVTNPRGAFRALDLLISLQLIDVGCELGQQ